MKFSSMQIELYSELAKNRWFGKPRTTNFPNMSIPTFLKQLSFIHHQATFKDNPYAEYIIFEVEKYLNAGLRELHTHIEFMTSTLSTLPSNIKFDAIDNSPITLDIRSSSPLGYRAVNLLVGLDQLHLQAAKAKFFGLISHAQFKHMINSVNREFRKSFSIVSRFKDNADVTRKTLHDIDQLNLFCNFVKKDYKSFLDGQKRSLFLNKLSDEQLKDAKTIKTILERKHVKRR